MCGFDVRALMVTWWEIHLDDATGLPPFDSVADTWFNGLTWSAHSQGSWLLSAFLVCEAVSRALGLHILNFVMHIP